MTTIETARSAVTSKEILPGLHRVHIGGTELTRNMVLSLPVFTAVNDEGAPLPGVEPIIQVTTGRTMTVYEWTDLDGNIHLSTKHYMGSPRQVCPRWEFLVKWRGRLCVRAGIGEWPKQAPHIKGASAWLI